MANAGKDRLYHLQRLGELWEAAKSDILVSMRKTAYETAQQKDGKYYGFYKSHNKLSDQELLKSIKSSIAQIDKHKKWINNPLTKTPDFYSFDERRQKSLIEVHWPADINRHKDQIEIINGILKDRGVLL